MAAILNYPSSIGSNHAVNPGWIQIDIYKRRSPQNSSPLRTINLYLPEQLRNPSTVSWGTDSLGMIGNVMRNAANSFSDAGGGMDGVKAAFSNFWGGTWQNTKRTGFNAAGNVASAIIRAGGGSVSSDALMGSISGQVTNPYLTAYFKGVDFRTFEMVFKFVPITEKDCFTIDDIIKEFRASALPEGTGAKQTSFLGYPNEFEIRYIWKGKENKFLHKFKRCVLTGVDVDYTGMSMWTAMRNGFPAESVMTLRFSEIEIVLRDDVIKENY